MKDNAGSLNVLKRTLILLVLGIVGVGCQDSPTKDPPETGLVPTEECPLPTPSSLDDAQAEAESYVECLGLADSVNTRCTHRQRWLFPPDRPDGVAGAWVVGKEEAVCQFSGSQNGSQVFGLSESVLNATGVSDPANLGPHDEDCAARLVEVYRDGAESSLSAGAAWKDALICDGRTADSVLTDCWGPCYAPDAFYACRIFDESTSEQMVVVVPVK